jgi:hypothetical protein
MMAEQVLSISVTREDPDTFDMLLTHTLEHSKWIDHTADREQRWRSVPWIMRYTEWAAKNRHYLAKLQELDNARNLAKLVAVGGAQSAGSFKIDVKTFKMGRAEPGELGKALQTRVEQLEQEARLLSLVAHSMADKVFDRHGRQSRHGCNRQADAALLVGHWFDCAPLELDPVRLDVVVEANDGTASDLGGHQLLLDPAVGVSVTCTRRGDLLDKVLPRVHRDVGLDLVAGGQIHGAAQLVQRRHERPDDRELAGGHLEGRTANDGASGWQADANQSTCIRLSGALET